MKKLADFLFSTRLTGVLFILFAAAMGIATFIENDYGTQASKALVYNAWWFEWIMIIFTINFTGNIFRYRLYRKEKWAVLLFHLSFILILVGAGITRYISYEAIMPIKEGAVANTMLSEKTYLSIHIDDGKEQKPTIEKEYLFAPTISKDIRFIALVSRFFNFIRGGNDFSIHTKFRDKPVAINYVNYIPNVYEEFQADETGTEFLHFVESGGGTRHDHYIKRGELVNIHNALVAYDQQTEGAINLFTQNDSLFIKVPQDGDFMVMATQHKGTVAKDSVQPFNLRSLYSVGDMQFVIPEPATKGKLVTVSGDKDEYPDDLLEVAIVTENETKNVTLYGFKYAVNPPEIFTMDGLNFRLSYGAKQLELPFSIKLRDFQLDRYPGSHLPKSYASEVTVIDKDETFDFRIYMNHILDHKGFRFFQSSYDDTGEVEETHLSVNHDVLGTNITYIGYTLLYLGMLLILFLPKTRFGELRKRLNKIKKKKATLTIGLLLLSLVGFAQQDPHFTHEKVDSLLKATTVSKVHAERFSQLIIQDEGGRMKPVNTYASELLRKVSKKDTYRDMDANQVAVSLVTNPRIWYSVPFIYMKSANTKVRDLIGIPEDQAYASLSDFFTDRGEYKLEEEINKAHKKIKKNKYEESIINISGRVSLLYGAISGSIFKFFPLEGDVNHKWFSRSELSSANFKEKDSLFVKSIIPFYAQTINSAAQSGDYTQANELLEGIHKFQERFGSEVMPSDRKVKLEIFYNKYDIFKSLFVYYMLAGVFMLILLITQIFYNKKIIKLLVKISAIIIVGLFLYHLLGLGIRWYISGHVPWSNGYESMIYIAWATMLFGLLFGRKSNLTIAATAFVVSMILMFAHMNWMDPSIGNLVPVLDSYWVMIHVSIIVASYGPFTLSMILGLIALFLMAITNKKNKSKIHLQLKEITIINEMSMTVGLILLTIGNFLGGMWANESWGRYWGWDPKETWALVSIMVYAFVLHARLIPGLRGIFTFNVLAFFSFTAILMTYLGVNHLLSGLHSYATGDSAPIPYQIWTWLAIGVVVTVFAYVKNKKHYKK
tara:strand:- start:26052 stop:29222 length:3171 start_codon:yes stop_codon:yes gene_type:complete